MKTVAVTCTRALMALMALSGAAAWAHTGSHEAGKAAYDYSKAPETGYGKAFDPKQAARTIEIDMSDMMRYSPAEITVKRGETVRFVVRNHGKQTHEMVLGTMKELKEHAEHMKRHPGMAYDEPNMLPVPASSRGEMGWQFTRAGEFHYACLMPGHLEAGMVGKVVVMEK
jgi:uncharacterized cupredoxin-like copper-binding protein